MTTRLRRLRTVVALLPWVAVAIALAVAALWLIRRLVPMAILREGNDVAGTYLQTLGTIYAVLLAFVVIVVWQQFNDARNHVEREANQLLDLCRTGRGFPEPVRRELHLQLRRYVDAVLDDEWPAMACGGEVRERVTGILDELGAVLHGYEPTTAVQGSLQAQALGHLNDLSDARTNRLSSARTKIPLTLTILLYAGAVTTVGSMCLFAVGHFALHAVMIGALAGAVSHVLYLIGDLDDAFSGDYQVPRAPFVRVQHYLSGCGSTGATP